MQSYYNNELVTLYKGDCLEVMLQLKETFDCCITDLPYGTTSCNWDVVIPFQPMWKQLKQICKQNAPIVLFGSQPFVTDLINSNRKQFKYQMIWKKNVPTGMASAKYRPMKYHESVLVFHTDSKSTYNPIMKERIGIGKSCYNYEHYCGKSNHIDLDKIKKRYDPQKVQPSTVLQFDVVPNRKGKLHPTQKPVSLIQYLIKTYTNQGDTVLDFTAGSGTTGVVCMNTNRKCVLIQKEEKYCQIIAKRLEKNKKLF